MAVMPPGTPEQDAAEQILKEQSLRYQLKSFWRLWPYLWPKEKPSYKIRTLLAMIFTIAGQFVVVLAPFFLGRAIDGMTLQIKDIGLGNAIGMGIILLILAYGGFRLFSVMLSEGREYVFAPVAQYAKRAVATSTFAHLHKLSLRYHLEKRTGGLSRTIERGIRSIDFLFRFLLFNIGPTLLQLAIAGAAFWIAYSWEFALIAVAVVFTYIWFTVTTTEWRLKFRRDMNKKDTEANAKAIDSLLNYETVKYFGAEKRELERYSTSTTAYAQAAIKSENSLGLLNIAQSLITNSLMAFAMGFTVWKWSKGELSVGDLVAIPLVGSNAGSVVEEWIGGGDYVGDSTFVPRKAGIAVQGCCGLLAPVSQLMIGTQNSHHPM